jgi:hypothetical protein
MQMDNQKIVSSMREFVLECVNTSVNVGKYEVEQGIEDYFSNGNFCLSDHIDRYDINESVRSYMDDNLAEVVGDSLSDSMVSNAISDAINDRDISPEIDDAVNNYDFESIVTAYLESQEGKAMLADVILTMVIPKVKNATV